MYWIKSTWFHVLGLLCFCQVLIAQEPKTKQISDLHRQLWNYAGYGNHIGYIDANMDSEESLAVADEKELDNEQIGFVDDPGSGFLMISDCDGPCGCGWCTTVKAYSVLKKQPIFVKKHDSYCSYSNSITSSVDWKTIFPDKLNWQSFYNKNAVIHKENALLYVSVDLLRYGTDMLLTIRPVPLGRNVDWNESLLLSTEGGEDAPTIKQHLSYFKEAFDKSYQNYSIIRSVFYGKRLFSEEELDDFAERLAPYYQPDRSHFNYSLKQDLAYVYSVYQELQKIDYHRIVLGWDEKKGQFYVKGKTKLPMKSFIEFIQSAMFYRMRC